MSDCRIKSSINDSLIVTNVLLVFTMNDDAEIHVAVADNNRIPTKRLLSFLDEFNG